MLGLEYRCKTKEARNCDILEEKLKKNCVPVRYVARHSIFGIKCFEIIIDDDKKKIYENDICRILNIPEEWVGFTQHNPKIICVKEDELLDKYANCDGLLKFKCDWSIKGKSFKAVEQKLKESGIEADVGIDCCGDFCFYSIRLGNGNPQVHWNDIAKALNVNDVGVVEPNKTYIVKKEYEE